MMFQVLVQYDAALLLEHFGSTTNVRSATREDLKTVVGSKVADALINHFSHATEV